MKKVNIFIASSNDEKVEREILKNLIFQINGITKNYGIEINPVMWELISTDFKSGLERKQNEYNEYLNSSQIVFFIFSKRVGKYTLEEFEKSCKKLNANENLFKMFVYFKNVELGRIGDIERQDLENHGEIFKLRDRIRELNQVYGTYETVDELQTIVTKEILQFVVPFLVEKNTYSDNIKELFNLFEEINKPHQVEKRDNIIEDCLNSLYILLMYNIAPNELDQANFYGLCHNILSTARMGSTIDALSLMLKCEWDNSFEEKQFWKDNSEAVKRHAKLERIFVVNRNESHRLKSNPQIINHIKLESDFDDISSYVVEKEVLLKREPLLLEQAGNGFILINSETDHIALLDESPNSEQRAKPIVNKDKLKEISNVFNKIKKYAVPINEYIDQIPLSHYKKEMISIFVTTKCNLNCDYCFTNKNEGSHKGQTISFEFVKKGIDKYFESEFVRHVRFFGAGEPTTEFKLLQKICKYALEKSDNTATFEIQTNGAFDDNVAYWMRDNIDIIWISCDGTPDIQDKHRPFLNKKDKTSKFIEKNIRILLKDESKAFVGVRATITSENMHRQKEIIDYFFNLGIREIWVDPIFPAVGEADISDKDFDTMEFAREFLSAAKYANSKKMFYGSILTCNFNDSVNKHCRACLPVPHLTTDGYISACDMALFGEDDNHMSSLIYGKWDKLKKEIVIFKDKKYKIQSRTTENMEHCETCSAKEHCGGYCLGEVLNETGNLFGQKKETCKAIRFLDKEMDAEIRKYYHTHP